MKERNTDSVQNRFTAYLVAAIGNTRRICNETGHIIL